MSWLGPITARSITSPARVDMIGYGSGYSWMVTVLSSKCQYELELGAMEVRFGVPRMIDRQLMGSSSVMIPHPLLDSQTTKVRPRPAFIVLSLLCSIHFGYRPALSNEGYSCS